MQLKSQAFEQHMLKSLPWCTLWTA